MTETAAEFGTAEYFDQRAQEARAQAAAVPTIKPDGLHPRHFAILSAKFDQTRTTFEKLAQTHTEAAQAVRDGTLRRKEQ